MVATQPPVGRIGCVGGGPQVRTVRTGSWQDLVIRRRDERRAVVDDDLASWSLISAITFQPSSWPDACGYVDEHGWICGYTRAEHTHISGDQTTPP